MDFENARHLMIEQQIRPWNVLDQSVLDLLEVVKRENFLCESLRNLAFVDCELPVRIDGQDSGETMMAPKVEARMLQELNIQPHEKVLEIGTGSGYMAALLAQKGAHVTTVEINPGIAEFARRNLQVNHINRVKVVEGCGYELAPTLGEFDVILQSGCSEVVPEVLIKQLKNHGRFMGIVGQEPVLSATLVSKSSTGDVSVKPLFETSASVLKNSPKAEAFQF